MEHSGETAHGDTFQPCVLSAREAWKRAKIEEDAAVQAEAKTLAKWDKAVKRLLGATSFFQTWVSRHPGASASSYWRVNLTAETRVVYAWMWWNKNVRLKTNVWRGREMTKGVGY